MNFGLASVLFLVFVTGSLAQMPGGIFTPPQFQYTEEMQNATAFAVSELGSRFQLNNIAGIQQQVVSGMMYHIYANILKDTVNRHECYFAVQSQPWMPSQYTMTEFHCRLLPGMQQPVNQMPGVQMPGVQMPGVQMPGVQMPGNQQG